MALVLIDEFRAIVDALEARGVEYAVVGTLALAVHGVGRATTDIDLLVRPEDVDRALAAVDLRPTAVALRLQRVSELRDLCLWLAPRSGRSPRS